MGALLLAVLLLVLFMDRLIARVVADSLPWTISPTVWLLFPWCIAAGLYALPIFVHREALSLEHVGYITLCLTAYSLGAILQGFVTRSHSSLEPSKGPAITQFSHRTLISLAALGLLGSLFTIYDNLVVTGISLSERLTGGGLNAAREMNFGAQVAQLTGPFHLLEWLSGLGLIYILCYLGLRFQQKVSEHLAWLYFSFFVATLFVVLVNSLLVSGGRMGIVMFGVVLAQAILLDRQKCVAKWFGKKSLFVRVLSVSAICTALLAAVVSMATVFVQKRSDDRSPTLQLYLSHRADLTRDVYSATKEVPLARYGLFTLSYFTIPLPTFGLYYDLPEQRMPGPLWGQYNFPGIADRIVKRIDPSEYRVWWDARFEVFRPLTRDGYGGNVYSTLLRDLAADVGWKFVPVVMLIIGAMTSLAVRRAYGSGNPMWVAVACSLLCISLFSVLHSVVYIQTVGNLFFIGGLVLVSQAVRRRLVWKRVVP